MSKQEENADGIDNTTNNNEESNDNDDNHEEATQILTNLLSNQTLGTNTIGGDNGNNNATQVGEAQAAAIQQMMAQLAMQAGGGGAAIVSEEDKKHAFWDTQPMLDNKGDDNNTATNATTKSKAAKSSTLPTTANTNIPEDQHKPIIPDKLPSELRQEPYNMPKGFEWCQVSITNPTHLTEVYNLLYQNYVEDDECMFRFDYSKDFLLWALTPPGYKEEFHLGVRSSKSGKLMAFITGVPAKVRVYDVEKDMVEVNFLCVHKKLRSKRLAPVLIKEITRRVNHTGIFQAVYTAGVVLPGHVASCRYWHRTLDAKKLVDIGFTRVPPRMTMARFQKMYKLPNDTGLKTLRPMTKEDVPAAHKLVVKELEKYKLSVVFTEEEFAHWLLPREGVVSSFVNVTKQEREGCIDGEEEVITDFCSYYHLHSSVLGNDKHSTLHAAYAFYNAATTVGITELMRDCLILAKNEGHDVFNALNLMENDRFLEDLKFGMGDGNLQYYVYNWLCPTMEHGDVGLVLL